MNEQLDRSSYLGSSDIAAILGISPWKTPLQVYLAKVEGAEEQTNPEREAVLARGRRMEPFIREWAREDFGLEIVEANRRYKHPTIPYLAAEIDFEWRDEDGRVQSAEIKTASPFAGKQWGEAGTDNVPMHYTAQMLYAQACRGNDLTLCLAAFGFDDLRPYRVRRDAEMIEVLETRAVAFWEGNVLAKVPPPATSLNDAKLLYAREMADAIEATPEIAEIAAEIRLRKAALTGDQAKIDLLELNLKKFMGPHTEIVDGTGRKVASWKTQERKAYTVQASSSRVFRIYGEVA